MKKYEYVKVTTTGYCMLFRKSIVRSLMSTPNGDIATLDLYRPI